MARDVQIRLGDSVGPASYTVPNATEIQPKAINATFDGTGAAGAFVPTAEIVSDGGVVIARVPCQTTVAAGGSAEVTFAPFLRADTTGGTTASAAPSIATFYRSTAFGDPVLSVPPAGSPSTNIPWLHASLPSDGSITGPFVSNTTVQFNAAGFALEMLYTQWDAAGYNKSAVIGTNSRIIEADQYALANAGAGASIPFVEFGDATTFVRPNGHIVTDEIHAYVDNGDAGAKTVLSAYLVIYFWAAAGYSGGIPGWPA